MPSEMLKHIIWDIDGTLLNSGKITLRSMEITEKKLGIPHVDPEYIRQHFGIPGLAILQAQHVPNAESVHKVWCEEMEKISDQARPFDGIVEVLTRLKAMGVHMGVVTSRPRDMAETDLRAQNILQYFSRIVSFDDTEQHKPNPAPVEFYLKQEGVRPEQCIYVGDTSTDCACAHAAGAQFLLAGWGSYEREAMPDEITLEQPGDVLKYVSLNA